MKKALLEEHVRYGEARFIDKELVRPFVNRIHQDIAELEEAMKPKTCEWYKEDEEDWRGQCGCIWGFNGENPIKAEAYFCPQCGGKIIEIESKGDA